MTQSRRRGHTGIEQLITCFYLFCQNFFMDFSRKSGPCLLSRSVLQFVYFPSPGIRFGTTPLVDVLRESVKALVAPPVLMARHPLATNPRAIECVDAFFTYCNNIYSFVTFIQICGYNKARQRDKLAHLLDDFANLEDEVDRICCETYIVFWINLFHFSGRTTGCVFAFTNVEE